MIGSRQLSRAHIAFAHDVGMAALSFVVALWLRLGDGLFVSWSVARLIAAAGLFALVAAGVFLSLRLYRGIWRYASVDDLVALTKAATLTVLIFLPLLFLATRLDVVPRSFPLINWFCLLALLGVRGFSTASPRTTA
jgi:O-antigen biosynthesis protein WbqV